MEMNGGFLVTKIKQLGDRRAGVDEEKAVTMK